MAEKAKKMKLNYGKTLLIGFAFMASSIAWGVYDPNITTLLNKILGESALIAGSGRGRRLCGNRFYPCTSFHWYYNDI